MMVWPGLLKRSRIAGCGVACQFYKLGARPSSNQPGLKLVHNHNYDAAELRHRQAELHKHGLAPPVGNLVQAWAESHEDDDYHEAVDSFEGWLTGVAELPRLRNHTPGMCMLSLAVQNRHTINRWWMDRTGRHFCPLPLHRLRECDCSECVQQMRANPNETIVHRLDSALCQVGMGELAVDMHAGNIGIWRGTPVLIDSSETESFCCPCDDQLEGFDSEDPRQSES